jgi:hypothetical protein
MSYHSGQRDPWCYHPSVSTCAVNGDARQDFSFQQPQPWTEDGAKQACEGAGGCWQPTNHAQGRPWCFTPKPVTTTTTTTTTTVATVSATTTTADKGQQGTDGWTPWYSEDVPTGMGDVESYQSLDEAHNLCGANGGNGGHHHAVSAECRTKDTQLTSTAANQVATCSKNGFKCLQADNNKCFGANAACINAAKDACEDADAEGCHWGCYDYEVRFKCTDHYKYSEAPTAAPTMAPTSAPTSAPTPFPTPAPSPRGAFAAAGIGLIPSVNRIEHHDMESCQEAFAHTWRKNQQVTVECTANDDAVHVTAGQNTGTPGVLTSLYGSHQADGSDITANQWYAVIVKGKVTEPAQAYPYMRCANSAGVKKNILWRTGTAAKAVPLGTEDGFSISYIKESTHTKNCEFGVLFHSPSVGQKMYIDYTEVRPLEDYEEKDIVLEVGAPGNIQAAYPEHMRGRLANAAFKLGTIGWFKNEADSSKLFPRGEVVSGEGSKGIVLEETAVPVGGKRNGIVQKSISVEQGTKYKVTVKGKFTPASTVNGAKAALYVGDASGSQVTDVVWNSHFLSTEGESTISTVFTAPSSRINIGVLSVEAAVGNRIMLSSSDIHVYNPLTEDNADAAAAQVSAVGGQTCDCDFAVHPSKVTRCEFTVNPLDPKHHHVLKVTHQKETVMVNGVTMADYHRCGDVSSGAVPLCKCCDCIGGAIHTPGYDINTLMNAQNFLVKFNAFSSDAGDIKPEMTGKCRYDDTSTKHWCCQCTEGNCGKGYGDEVCFAHDETPGHGINFWGRNYEYKSSFHGKPTFQNEHTSEDDTFTVIGINAA